VNGDAVTAAVARWLQGLADRRRLRQWRKGARYT
jgi:hypothetical protein